MMKLSRPRIQISGFSLLEILVAAAVSGLLLYLGSNAFMQVRKTTTYKMAGNDVATDAMNLNRNILSIARVAQACRVISSTILECDVIPPGTSTTKIWRYELVSRTTPSNDTVSVVHTSYDGGPGEDFPAAKSETGVDEFVVCDGAMIAASTCPLLPVAMNVRWAAIWGSNDSFFRYFFKMGGSGKNRLLKPIVYQSAFYLRNKNLVNGLSYEIGND